METQDRLDQCLESLGPLWSEPAAWGQPREQANPSSAKGQHQGSPIHPLTLEMQKKSKERSGAA